MKSARSPFLSPSYAISSLAILILAGNVHAVDFYWDNGQAGNVAWGQGANWANNAAGTGSGVPNSTATADVFFNVNGLSTHQWTGLNSTRNARSITVRSVATGGTTIRAHTGANTANTLNLGAGGVTVEAGAGLFIFQNSAFDNADGSSSGNTGLLTVNLSANQTWTVNNAAGLTSFARLSGSGNLTKAGTGTLRLTNNVASHLNTYAGKTIINGGILSISQDRSLGNTTGSAVADRLTFNGGTLSLDSASGFQINPNRGITLNAGGGTFAPSAGSQYFFDGIVTGGGDLTVDGPGIFMLRGAANVYTGDTFVKQGTLKVGRPGGGFEDRLPGGTILTIGSGSTSAAFDMNSLDQTLAGLATSGSGTANRVYNNGGARTLTINNSGNHTFGGAIENNLDLVKSNTGTLTLTGTNTYNGTTSVTDGKLVINGTIVTSSLTTVSGTGTLGGSGTVGALTVASGGSLAPGNSIESLASGSLTLDGGSTYAYEIDNDAAAGVAGDLMAVTGTIDLSLSNDSILTLAELGSGAWAIGEKLTLISYSGAWNGGLFSYGGGTLADDSTFSFSGSDWFFNYDDTVAGSNYTGDLTGPSYVTMTVVPEPAIALLGSFGLLALLRRRRN